ncbi:Purple acid phosphatase 22 [Apostasia shenzhenica]|uniref:Purple acid phosphatase n=1 Tax=Apostasia shenzhenica TaxID=1088818 RepID=A0A2H9ZW69_9ASPA|nr:Purple acid phosphatase 22 [Apostasia shenzhenica]
MAKPWFLLLGVFALALSGFAASASYVRPPPRRTLVIKNSKPESHPQQVHTSMVGADHIQISWITEDKNIPSLVEYGKTSSVYDISATGKDTSYRYFFYESNKIHHVKIGPLEPDTVYYYRCGGVGEEFSFKTPPATLPIEFIVVGDLGQTEWTKSTLSHINSSDYDLLILPGDLSYADSHQPLWDSFGRLVEPHTSRRPWMTTEGNHEIESFLPIFSLHPFVSYNARWRMPFEESCSPSNLFYSFDAAAAAAHVLMLGSYADYGESSEQLRWLRADLAGVDRTRTPWLLAVVHAPWYNTNDAHQGEGEEMRKAVEEALYAARVDVVFAGHVHAYERFTRVYNNEANPCGPIHITIGDGGNREGLALDSAPFSLFREASFGHGRLRIVDRERAHWAWHRNDDSYSTVRDDVWLQSLSSSPSCMPVDQISPSSSSSSSTKEEL